MIFRHRYTNSANLRLWFFLALIPVIISGGVFLYGAYAFDDTYVLELDNSANQSQLTVASNYDYEFENLSTPMEFQPEMEKTSSILETESKKAQKTESQKLEEIKIVEKRKIDKNGKPVLVRVQESETLETMSERYLGHKIFWVYLNEVNADKIHDAGGVKQGMALFLPDTAYFHIHAEDQQSLEKALEEARKIDPEASLSSRKSGWYEEID